MSFWDFIWFFAVAAAFVALVVSACTAYSRKEHYDTPCFRNIGIAITAFILLTAFVNPPANRYKVNSTVVTIWNRSGRYYNRAGWQIITYRQPSSHLAAVDYMMGVELARSNACYYFDFSRDADIDNFKRCADFFPEFLEEYRMKHEERVGICI